MAAKQDKLFNINDALEFVLDGNDSEAGELSFDEEDDDDERILLDGVSDIEAADDDDKEGSDVDDEEAGPSTAGNCAREATSKKVDHSKRVYRWRHRDIQEVRSNFCTNEQIRDVKEPLEYFKDFWTDELTNLVVEQTNLYSVQQSGANVNTSKDEMEKFFGMHVKMGIVKLPTYVSYWSTGISWTFPGVM